MRSCQDLWTFLPEGSGGSGHGITSVEVEAEEVGNGHELAAALALAAYAQLSAHQIALATAALAERPCLAGWALVDRLVDEPPLPTKVVGEAREGDRVNWLMAEPMGTLSAGRRAVPSSADGLELPLTDGAGRQRSAIVTRIVMHGGEAHAPTAWASWAGSAGSRTS